MRSDPVLECEDCGVTLKRLTPAEEQQMALNPYNFVAYCKRCAVDHERGAR